MTITTSSARPTAASRRLGYAVAVIVNAAVLFAANVWPGWQAVPFLTADTALVMGFVNASILASLAANVVYLVRDEPRVKATGDLLSTAVALVAVVRVWQVFPFDFGTGSVDWALGVRIALVLGMVGGVIQIGVALGRLLTNSTRTSDRA